MLVVFLIPTNKFKLSLFNKIKRIKVTCSQTIEANFHVVSCTLLIVYKTKANIPLSKINYCLDAKSREPKSRNKLVFEIAPIVKQLN